MRALQRGQNDKGAEGQGGRRIIASTKLCRTAANQEGGRSVDFLAPQNGSDSHSLESFHSGFLPSIKKKVQSFPTYSQLAIPQAGQLSWILFASRERLQERSLPPRCDSTSTIQLAATPVAGVSSSMKVAVGVIGALHAALFAFGLLVVVGRSSGGVPRSSVLGTLAVR